MKTILAINGGLKVLITHDYPGLLEVVKKALAKFEIDVFPSEDHQAVLDNYKPGFYDGMILNIRMPKINGVDLARKIWEIDPKANICFWTGFELFYEEVKRIFPSRKVDVLRQPISASALANYIKTSFVLSYRRDSVKDRLASVFPKFF